MIIQLTYETLKLRRLSGTSGQEGGVGRSASLSCITKRRITISLKTKNNQDCLKIELFRNPTRKELKKKHSFRQVGWAAGVERMQGKAMAGGPGSPTFVCG